MRRPGRVLRDVLRGESARARRHERGGSVGSITPFVLIAVIALIPLAGLVIDGGRQLNGRARAIAYAQEGARAGAQALDLDVQQTRLVPELASQLVERYCDEAMNGDGAIQGDGTLTRCEPVLVRDSDGGGQFLTIGVETTVEVDPLLLDMFGAGALQASGRAVARAFTGITEADEDAVPTVPPPSLLPNEDGDGGLPTVGPGEQTPIDPGVLPPCVTPPPTTPTPSDEPGGPGDDPGPGDDETSDPTPSPTPTPPPSPPPNNDLDGDNAPDCPTTPTPGDDGGGDDDEDPAP